jgi:hypothetical protein
MVSDPVRTRKNRVNNKVRGSEVFGGVQINATEYTTGRVDVQIQTVPVTNSQRAAYAFGE